MLSRLVRPSASVMGQFSSLNVAAAQQTPQFNTALLARALYTSKSLEMPVKEGPERDLVNFPRPKRATYPGKVRMGFVPDEWYTFFYNKTGVTGPYAFGVGFFTWALSKEMWVLEHEFWGGVSFFIMIVYGVKKFGPQVSAWLDKEQQQCIDEMNEGKVNEIKGLKASISSEKVAQMQAEASKQLFDIKRENIALQLEAAYRERMMTVFSEVKKRLDYQVEKINVERSIQQKHMVNWIIDNVKKAVSQESEAENLKKCIADLKAIAGRQ